jgi:nitroreductase
MFRELALKRRSIRSFIPKELDDKKINEILETAILAPSAGNLQSWEFILIKDKTIKQKLVKIAYDQDFIAQAPIVLVLCANKERSKKKYGKRGELYSIIDASLAGAYLQLAIADSDLATVWVGAFDSDRLKQLLDIPEGVEPLGLFPIGYPAEEGKQKERFPLEKVLHKGKF